MIDETYSDLILELNKNPLNKRKIKGISYRDKNPFCGDEIEMILNIENGKVIDAGFQGHGCAISQAAASLISEQVKGKSVGEIVRMDISSVLQELGVPLLKNNHVRIKCALLPLKAMKMAGFIYLARVKE
ncbi:MAG: iron-sulfur cluster assembly scaffold protein [Nanoarchaeota archaeon]